MANAFVTQPLPPAPRPLRFPSNVAAGFVEIRAGHEICRRATTGDISEGAGKIQSPGDNTKRAPSTSVIASAKADEPAAIEPSPTFVRALDCFLPTGEAPSEESYYAESARAMERFQRTLKAFAETPQMRKVFRHYGISARDPASYDLAYITQMQTLVGEYGDEASRTRLLKRFMRSCFEKAGQRMETLRCLLQMVPTDFYGSVISGGFSLILLAVERHEDARAAVQDALASIPRELHCVRQMTGLHIHSPELHGCADRVFVSVFALLERVVAQLSRTNWLQKSRHEGDLLHAVKDMEGRVRELKDQVAVCGQLKLGRVEEQTGTTMRLVQDLHEGQNDVKGGIDRIIQLLQSGVCSALYNFVASSLEYDAANGLRTVVRRADPQNLVEEKKRLMEARAVAEDWMSRLGDFDPMPDSHIAECLAGFVDLDPGERDKVEWIHASEELRRFLLPPRGSSPKRSRMLTIQADEAPEALYNPLTFSAATLALMLAKMTDSPVLSFFFGLRRNESRDAAYSGSMAVCKSLCGQLMRFLIEKRGAASLPLLLRPKQAKLLRRSRTKARYASNLLRQLLGCLPEDETVFIVLDALSHLGRGDDDLVTELAGLAREMPQLVFRILVTDPMPSCAAVRDLADLTLHVPEDVDGWKNDVNLTLLDEETSLVVEEWVSARRRDNSDTDDQDTSSSESDYFSD